MATKKQKLKSSIVPATVTVSAGGEDFIIGRFNTAQTFDLLEPAFEIFDHLKASGGELTPVQLFRQTPGAVYLILSVAVGKDVNFVKALPFNETLALMNAVLETNLDFFTDQVLPEFMKLMAKL